MVSNANYDCYKIMHKRFSFPRVIPSRLPWKVYSVHLTHPGKYYSCAGNQLQKWPEKPGKAVIEIPSADDALGAVYFIVVLIYVSGRKLLHRKRFIFQLYCCWSSSYHSTASSEPALSSELFPSPVFPHASLSAAEPMVTGRPREETPPEPLSIANKPITAPVWTVPISDRN